MRCHGLCRCCWVVLTESVQQICTRTKTYADWFWFYYKRFYDSMAITREASMEFSGTGKVFLPFARSKLNFGESICKWSSWILFPHISNTKPDRMRWILLELVCDDKACVGFVRSLLRRQSSYNERRLIIFISNAMCKVCDTACEWYNVIVLWAWPKGVTWTWLGTIPLRSHRASPESPTAYFVFVIFVEDSMTYPSIDFEIQ